MANENRDRLGNHCRFRGGVGFPEVIQGNSSGDYPFIKVSDMNLPGNERVIEQANNWISEETAKALSAKPFNPGTTVFAKVGAALLLNRRRKLAAPTYIDNNLMGATPINGTDENFLFYTLSSIDLGRLCQVGAVPSVNQGDLAAIKVHFPPVSEQKKIAEILGACDEAVEAQDRLLALKQDRKKGLAQRLLTGKVRFPKFAGQPWREVTIGSLMKEVDRYVEWDDSHQYKLLSIRRRSGGPFDRGSLPGSEILTKTLKVVRPGDFLVAKMQVTHGALAMVPPAFDGWHVSDSYICLVPKKPGEFDMRFFNYLSQQPIIWHYAYISSYGVTIEKMTFSLHDFLKKKIMIPPTKAEAEKICDLLDAANDEIRFQQQKLEQLKQQKKGLMQLLLTGKVRVRA